MTLFKLILPAILVAGMWGYLPVMEKKILQHVSIKTLIVLFGLLYGIVSLIICMYYYKEIYEDIKNKNIFELFGATSLLLTPNTHTEYYPNEFNLFNFYTFKIYINNLRNIQ